MSNLSDDLITRLEAPDLIPGVAPFYSSDGVSLYLGDSLELLGRMEAETFDMIFADPPYLLSDDGITCHSGRMVSVNKGEWDRSRGVERDHEFVLEWLDACRRVMKPDATIWVSGTHHIIYSVGFAMQKLGFKILNDIVWYKINPPPNLSCRYFTHSTEIVLWAARSAKSRHTFNYDEMRAIDNAPFDGPGRQMKSIWAIAPPTPLEKRFGKHPTQKPVQLLNRLIRASTHAGDLILDPFVGSGTTCIAALANGRRCVGIDTSEEYLRLAQLRLEDREAVRAIRSNS